MASPTPEQHWDAVYGSRSPTEVSWYQQRPALSLALVHAAAPDHAASIIDIGSGASSLLSELAVEGYRDLTGLDASAVAVANTKARYGDLADHIDWVVADITKWTPGQIGRASCRERV